MVTDQIITEIEQAARQHIELDAGRLSDRAYDRFADLLATHISSLAVEFGWSIELDDRAGSRYWELTRPTDDPDEPQIIKVRVSNHGCRHGGVDVSITCDGNIRGNLAWLAEATKR